MILLASKPQKYYNFCLVTLAVCIKIFKYIQSVKYIYLNLSAVMSSWICTENFWMHWEIFEMLTVYPDWMSCLLNHSALSRGRIFLLRCYIFYDMTFTPLALPWWLDKHSFSVRGSDIIFFKIIFYRKKIWRALYYSQLTVELCVVIKQRLCKQRSSHNMLDISLFHLLIADGTQSFDVKICISILQSCLLIDKNWYVAYVREEEQKL